MLNNSKKDPYACIKDFRNLNGRKKPQVVVGDRPDARIGRLFLKDIVRNNRSIHCGARYTRRYIRFQNSGKIFDRARQTIDGDPAYIFHCSLEIDILWRKQTAKQIIESCYLGASQSEKATSSSY